MKYWWAVWLTLGVLPRAHAADPMLFVYFKEPAAGIVASRPRGASRWPLRHCRIQRTASTVITGDALEGLTKIRIVCGQQRA
jgi:hypothetical protein